MSEEKQKTTSEQETTPVQAKPSTWKRVVAVVIDLAVAFFVFGYIIAAIFGQTTAEGFELQGGPAFIFFAAIGVYFYLGYVVWKKSLGLMLMGLTKK